LQTNLEAATEAARQLRLRNIGGVVVIDFIDMDRTRDRVKVMDALENALREDRTRTRIVQLSPLGLVEMTRRREGDSLRDILHDDCPYCHGEGMIKSPAAVALSAYRSARELAARHDGPNALEVTLHPQAALEFLGHDFHSVQELESLCGRKIFVRATPALHREAVQIETGDSGDFTPTNKELAVGKRLEIASQSLIAQDELAHFACIHRVLIRFDEPVALPHKELLWAEVVDVGRWFIQVRVVAHGEPKLP
jgi:ribonuclease G